MYNAQETLTVEPDREDDEKRQADDQKTKQKMESIRSKLKTNPRKVRLVEQQQQSLTSVSAFLSLQETHRPPSASKQTKSNLVHHHRRTIRIDTGSNLSTNGDTSSGVSSLEQQYRPLPYSYATTNLFNTYHLLATSTVHQHELLHEEDSEDDDEDDDDDSHDDDDDEQKPQPPVFSSRSFSPAVFSRKTHPQPLLSQTSLTTPVTDLNSNAGLVDYVHHSSSSDKSLALKNESSANNGDQQHQLESVDDEDNCRTPTNGLASAATSTNMEKAGTETQSRNDTALSKALWTDDEEAIQMSDDCSPVERTATSQSVRFRHSTSTTVITRMPTLPSMTKKSSLPSATQQFYHHYKPVAHDQQSNKSSSRPLVPLSLSKYRRIPANLHMTSSSKQPTLIGASSHSMNTSPKTENNSSASSFNEQLMLNKRIETLKTPGKQPPPQSTAPSPASSSTTILPSASSRRYAQQQQQQQQDARSMGTTGTLPSTPPATVLPMDSTKVTIGESSGSSFKDRICSLLETIGPKTVSALLRQNATIEPVDTSRGVGRHLVSLLTTASKETASLKTGTYFESSFPLALKTTRSPLTRSQQTILTWCCHRRTF